MILVFTIDKQIITRRDNEKVVRDSVNYLHVNFSFSEEWTGDKTAVFKSKSGIAYNVLVGSDGSCLVPWEVLKEEYFEVSAFCGDLITANVVKVFTIPSGYEIGSQGRIPTPDIYTQIIARLSAIEAEIDPTAIQQVVDEYLSDKDYVTEQDVEQIVSDYIEAHKDELKGDTGATGPQGPQGIQGPKGDTGEGVAAGGTTGQVLVKSSDADYETEWSSALNEISEAVNIHEERRNIFDYTDVTDNKYRTSTLGSSINDSVDKANGWYSNQIWEVKKGDVIYQSTRWFPLLIYNENGILVEYRTSGDTGGVYTITDDNAKYLTIQASAHTDEYLYKLMLSINEPLPAEYVPYTDVRTVSQIDAVEEKIPTDGRAILDKGFVILTFDAFDDVNDARFDIVNEYGFKANAACTYGVSWEDISAKVLKQGWDAYLYSGHGYPTADSYYVDNPSAEVQAVWDSYVKEEVDYALSQGVSNPTAWGCRQGKSCDGLENACRKYGIKMVRGGAKATKYTEKFSYSVNPPTGLRESTTQSCISAFTAAANVGYGVVFTTHGIYETAEEAETHYGMTETTLRQFLSALKTLVDEGKLEVLTFREVYQKYYQNDALYNNYDRLAYRAFGTNLPTTPTTNGTYTLQATVADGVVTYSWV